MDSHKIRKAESKEKSSLPLAVVNSAQSYSAFLLYCRLKCMKDFIMCKIIVVLNVNDYSKPKLLLNHEKIYKRS